MPHTSLEKGEGALKGPYSEGVKEKLDSLLEAKYRFTASGAGLRKRGKGALAFLKNLRLRLSLSRSRSEPLSRHAWAVLIESREMVSFCLSSPILSTALIF